MTRESRGSRPAVTALDSPARPAAAGPGHRATDPELERRLGHANDRYLRLYTNPPDDIAAGYVEDP
jgi:hypothetical protein